MFLEIAKTRSRLFALCACTFAAGTAFGHIHLDAPDGGEILTAGSTYSIEWHVLLQHSTQNWDLWYSTTGPDGPWLEIATDLPPGDITPSSPHSYDWLVPSVYTTEARVRVGQDNIGTDYFDISNHNFTIVPEPSTLSLIVIGAFGLRRKLSR